VKKCTWKGGRGFFHSLKKKDLENFLKKNKELNKRPDSNEFHENS